MRDLNNEHFEDSSIECVNNAVIAHPDAIAVSSRQLHGFGGNWVFCKGVDHP